MRKLRSHMRWNYTNRTCEARAIGAQTKTILCANFTELSSNIHILCPSSSGILHKWSSVSPMNHKCGGFFCNTKEKKSITFIIYSEQFQMIKVTKSNHLTWKNSQKLLQITKLTIRLQNFRSQPSCHTESLNSRGSPHNVPTSPIHGSRSRVQQHTPSMKVIKSREALKW